MGMGRGVPEADAMKSISGALAIAILLAVVGPGIDITPKPPALMRALSSEAPPG